MLRDAIRLSTDPPRSRCPSCRAARRSSLQEDVERLARQLLDDVALDVDARAVAPVGAGLRRQAAASRACRSSPAAAAVRSVMFMLGVAGADVEARGVAHQLPHGHRLGLRHFAIRRRDLQAGELGNVLRHRIVERPLALLPTASSSPRRRSAWSSRRCGRSCPSSTGFSGLEVAARRRRRSARPCRDARRASSRRPAWPRPPARAWPAGRPSGPRSRSRPTPAGDLGSSARRPAAPSTAANTRDDNTGVKRGTISSSAYNAAARYSERVSSMPRLTDKDEIRAILQPRSGAGASMRWAICRRACSRNASGSRPISRSSCTTTAPASCSRMGTGSIREALDHVIWPVHLQVQPDALDEVARHATVTSEKHDDPHGVDRRLDAG